MQLFGGNICGKESCCEGFADTETLLKTCPLNQLNGEKCEQASKRKLIFSLWRDGRDHLLRRLFSIDKSTNRPQNRILFNKHLMPFLLFCGFFKVIILLLYCIMLSQHANHNVKSTYTI